MLAIFVCRCILLHSSQDDIPRLFSLGIRLDFFHYAYGIQSVYSIVHFYCSSMHTVHFTLFDIFSDFPHKFNLQQTNLFTRRSQLNF